MSRAGALAAPPALLATLALALALAGCAAPAPASPDDFLLTPREDWFGVYLDGRKAGWSSTRTARETRAGRAVVARRSSFHLQTTSEGAAFTVRSENLEWYAAEPPFLLLGSESRQERNGQVAVTRTERQGQDLQVVTDAGARWLRRADYTLRDAFAVSLWIRAGAAPGAQRTLRSLDLDNLRIGRDRVRVLAARTATIAGVERHWFELQRTGPQDGTFERELVAPDGSTLSWTLGAMELRAEPPDQARRLDAPLDLDLLGRAGIDAQLGDPTRARTLVLRARGPGSSALQDGPGQTITALPDGAVRIAIDPKAGAEARAHEVRDALRATLRVPCQDPDLRALAQDAVGPAATDHARVQRLLSFVAAFVDDSYTACDHPTVQQIVTQRTGDCSDHALLFVTLARALGIPARVVLGLRYMGDDAQAFGPHEWCEVVLEGRWLPVDPTFAQLPADAARLRLPTEAALSAAVAGFTLELLEIGR